MAAEEWTPESSLFVQWPAVGAGHFGPGYAPAAGVAVSAG